MSALRGNDGLDNGKLLARLQDILRGSRFKRCLSDEHDHNPSEFSVGIAIHSAYRVITTYVGYCLVFLGNASLVHK